MSSRPPGANGLLVGMAEPREKGVVPLRVQAVVVHRGFVVKTQHLHPVQRRLVEQLDFGVEPAEEGVRLGEELELPRIEPRGKSSITAPTGRYTGIRRVGPESLRHFKRTFKEALKRELTAGTYEADNPIIIHIREDKRYRSWRERQNPDNNAVIIYMMDVSGSMYGFPIDISKTLLDNLISNLRITDKFNVVFFAGDQSYDHKEHTAAWLLFGLQFKEIFRERPAISIPDDHDIGQGNLWGENGKIASSPAGNDGGYFYHHEYVKMVERCQTANLPDPYDPTPVEQGIGVYYTNLVVGGIDFAILEDRKFKSGPAGKIPQMGPRPDHIRDPSYDPKTIDVEGLKLLGDRQLKFLDDWGSQKEGVAMKAVLSQTGFCGGAHLHGQKKNRLHADMDSNGWPQTGRNKAVKLIKKANAIHIGGDQHLSTIIHHGVDEWEDGPMSFIVPASVNSYYKRWWWPEDEKPGENSNGVLPWNGRFLDGFNNKITMIAYANPENPSDGGGYGLIRFNKAENNVTFECWPRDVDVTAPDAKQFTGWPYTFSLK